jgi:biopolymer transport protein ExbB
MKKGKKKFLAAGLIILFIAGSAAAQELSSAVRESIVENVKSNWAGQIFGPGMWPLWICSIALVAFVLERRKALQPAKIIDPLMVDRIADLMAEKKLEEACNVAKISDTVLGKAWAQGLHEFSLGGTSLSETLSNSTLLAFKPLKKNLLALATIGVISPLFGLLGTVLGMIITFSQIVATGGADKAELAGGIGLALFTTAGGLIVAIPAILGNRYFASRLISLADQAEVAISRINYRYAHATAQKLNRE